jgi:hypothetical protein
MKNLTLQLRLASLLSLILLACTAGYGQLTPSGDSYTNTASPNTNYGAKTTLDVESTQTTFIQFDLSSIPSGYTSADITKATLKLFVDGVTTAGSFNVDYVNGTWTESTIDASNAPALGTTIAASVPLTTKDKNQYILVDVTAAVQAWLSGTANDGIALVANSPLNATFDSKEATKTSHTAELDIVFASGGGSGITGITTAAGSGLIGGGTSGTLNLSLTNACAASQILQWNGSAWACASPGTGTITGVTAGTDLTGGGTSGNVTLSLNTAATNALYAQLGASNTFTTNQTVDGTITVNTGNPFGVTGSTTSTATLAAGVEGVAAATTGATIGVEGQSMSSSGFALFGEEFSPTGLTYGVYGDTESPSGYGVFGIVDSDSGTTAGVWGDTSSVSGYGVFGSAGEPTGNTIGVLGNSSSSLGTGVEGTSSYIGVYGNGLVGAFGATSTTTGGGVEGVASSPTGTTYGVEGTTYSSAGTGVIGIAAADGNPTISTSGAPFGVVGASPTTTGVYGASSGLSGYFPSTGAGVWGDTGGNVGVIGTASNGSASVFVNEGSNAATIVAANNTSTAGGEVFLASMPYVVSGGASVLAIIGDPGCGAGDNRIALQLSQGGMSGCNNYTLTAGNNGETYLNAKIGETVHLRVNNTDALVASGSGVNITGTLSATGTKNFRIDHPLDPANKYLTHAAIESSEVLNLYSGNAILDDSGKAVVQLPDWFEAVNKDFRYQLTNIGGFAPVYIAEEISGGRFTIAGGKPGAKVSWQVTGLRNDAWEKAYPMLVEADKGADRGHYLTPELYGQPATARVGYEAVPPESEQIVHHERPNLLRGNASPAQSITLPVPPKPVLPKIAPLPHAAPLAHPPANATKLEVNQK